MRPYSTDLRERVADAVDHKEGSLARSPGGSASASPSSSDCSNATATRTRSSPSPTAEARPPPSARTTGAASPR